MALSRRVHCSFLKKFRKAGAESGVRAQRGAVRFVLKVARMGLFAGFGLPGKF
jgi:hypothetical protein